MLPDWIVTILKSEGGYGAVIFGLCTVVILLGETIRRMYNQANKVYGFRLTERDTLTKALAENTAVIALMNKVTEQRNAVTEELAESIRSQMAAFQLLNARIELQHSALKDEVGRNTSAQVSAATIYAKTVDDIRIFLLNSAQRSTRK